MSEKNVNTQENTQEKISKFFKEKDVWEKVGSGLVSVLKALRVIIYPTKTMIGKTYRVMSRVVKATSMEKSTVSTLAFSEYYNLNEKARKNQTKTSVSVELSTIGGVLSLFRTTLLATYSTLLFLYIIIGITIPTIFGTMLVESLGARAAMSWVELLLLLPFYFMIISAMMAYQGFGKDSVEIEAYLYNIMMEEEFKYIYLKSREFNSEIADLTLNQIQDTLLLSQDKQQIVERKKDIKEFEKIISVDRFEKKEEK